MLKTSVVILNWNGVGFLEKYLPSVVSSVRDFPEVEVVVADNCSSDDSVALLRERFPEVKLVLLDRNYGFAQGYNKALGELDAEVFVLLNSDVKVEDGWFEPLDEWMRLHPDCGICGPKLLSLKNPEMFEYAGAAGGFIDKFGYPLCNGRVMDRVEKDEGQYDTPGEVFWISGAALAVRKSVFGQVGGFRSEFFMHMEEIDLCWRARLAGWKVHYVPRSCVFHLGGGTLVANSPAKAYYNHRNNLLMLQTNLPATYAIFSGVEMLAKISDQSAGPDFFGNCFDAFLEMDGNERNEFCRSAAKFGVSLTTGLIFVRCLMDMLSAAVYLFTGKASCAASVFRAHRDFRKMRTKASGRKLEKHLRHIFDGERRDIVQVMLTDEVSGREVGAGQVAIKCMLDEWAVSRRYFKKGKKL